MKALAATLAVAFSMTGVSTAEEVPPQQPPQAQEATVVSKTVLRPHKVVHRVRRFSVPSHPSQSYVFNVIVPYEAARWGVSAAGLHNRIWCESKGHWWATNGQYSGVLQFAPGTYSRGLGSIGTTKVAVRTTHTHLKRSRVYRKWSDGRLTRSRGRLVRQTVVTTKRGRINGSVSWLQVRIGAQAIRGISAVHSGEWSCGL